MEVLIILEVRFCEKVPRQELLITGEAGRVWTETGWFFKVLFFGGISNDIEMRKFITILKEQKADLNARDTVFGMTRIMWAATRNCWNLLDAWLSEPAVDVNAVDDFGNTALHYASGNGCVMTVALLLRDPRVISGKRNNDGRSPLALARRRNQQEVINLFDRLVAQKRAPIALWLRKSAHFDKLPWELILKIAKLCSLQVNRTVRS